MAIKPQSHRFGDHSDVDQADTPAPADVMVFDGADWAPGPGGGGGVAHDILSADHPDTDAADVPAGGDVLQWDGLQWIAAPAPAGTPGSTPTQIDIGDAQSGGVDSAYSRNDHGHAFPSPALGYPADVAAAEADGAATTPARADHVHGHGSGYLPDAHHAAAHTQAQHDAAEAVDLTGIAIGDSANAGTSVETPNADHRHPFAAPSAGYPVDVAAAEADGASTAPARADHVHGHGSGYLPNAHHNQSHTLDGGDHTISGQVAGEFLRATGAATFAIEAVPFSAGGTVLDPAGARFVMIWRAPFACTVTNVRGHRKGGTGATVNARRNQTSDHLASDLSLTTADAWTDGGAVQNTAYAAGDDLEIEIASITGAVTEIAIQVDFTRP